MSSLPLETRASRMIVVGSALTLGSVIGALVLWLLEGHWLLVSIWIIAIPVNLYLTLVNVRSHRLLTRAPQEKDLAAPKTVAEELKRREEEKRRERRAFPWRDYLGKRVLIGWERWWGQVEEFRVVEISMRTSLVKLVFLSGQQEATKIWCHAEDLYFLEALPEDKS